MGFVNKLFFLIPLLLPFWAMGQLTLQGQILNGLDQSPLPFASVFLANTTKGTTTDDKGNFTLTNVPPGKFNLVVSYVGFHPLKLTIQTSDPKFYRIGLKVDEKQLGGVTVKARNRRSADWATNVEFFKKQFIGSSEHASQCRLLNPEVLYFESTPEKLVARANEPLVIENKGLGYRLKFLLDEFSFDHPKQRVVYDGDAVFDRLTGTPRETKRWTENRRRAYHGSRMHFMRTLYQRNMLQEGFTVVRVVEQDNRDGQQKLVGLRSDILVRNKSLKGKRDEEFQTLHEKSLLDTLRSTPTRTVVAFDGLMQVTYTQEREPLNYQKTRPLRDHGYQIQPQTSLIQMLVPSVMVEPSGHFYDPRGILSKQYWSWEIIAEELPLDYDPRQDIR